VSLAKRAFVASAVVVAVVVGALALWKLRVVIALLFSALVISAAMRPGVEWLAARRVPRPAGVLIHYLALLIVIGVLLWQIVPEAVSQVQQAIGNVPTTHAELARDKRLRNLPSGASLIHPAISIGKKALEALVGIFFTFAVAAYWIFERER